MTFSIYLNNYSLKCQLKDLSLRFERSLTWNSNTTTQSFQNSDFLFPKKLCLSNLSFCQFLHLVRQSVNFEDFVKWWISKLNGYRYSFLLFFTRKLCSGTQRSVWGGHSFSMLYHAQHNYRGDSYNYDQL